MNWLQTAILAVFTVYSVNGLTCLQCDGVPQPRFCSKVVDCYDGEYCGAMKVLNEFGEYVYNLGCHSQKVCENFTSTTRACSECCKTSLCNSAACGEQGYPTNRGPVCYNCAVHTGSGPCHGIDFCLEDETCNVFGRQLFSSEVFTSKCISKHACKGHPGEHVSIIGKRDVSIMKRTQQHTCDLCCDHDLCNRNCSTAFPSLAPFTDCYDLLHQGGVTKDGVYSISTWNSNRTIQVYCDMTTAGGGWTVFQNRFDGSVDFYRNFSEYVNGFGDIRNEFWLGLDNIHELVSQKRSELRIDLSAANGSKAYETFQDFSIGSGPRYTLHISLGTGTVGDTTGEGLSFNNNAAFSTFDNDQDSHPDNCASKNEGAWWYRNCMAVHLNGQYCKPGTTSCGYHGMIYYTYLGIQSLRTSRMMFRRV